jgi:hypothetical protein
MVEKWPSLRRTRVPVMILKQTRGPAAKTETVAVKRVKKEDD